MNARTHQATTAIGPPDALHVPALGIARRVNAERVVLFGWGRAILLQMAHPLIAAGVGDHSAFRAAPWSAAVRLHATVRAMLTLAFGTDAAREHTLDGIRSIHRRVNGNLREAVGLYPAGTRYSAEDPDLVRWVHLTLLESVPLVYEHFVGPLTAADRDDYCAESAWVPVALGADPDRVPRRWADAQAQIDAFYASGAIVVGAQARQIAHAVMTPRLAWVVAPAAWLNKLVTVGLLPPHIREQYGFAWDARRDRRLATAVRAVRAARLAAPERLALWPDARG